MQGTILSSEQHWSASNIPFADRTDALQQAMGAVYRPIEITKRLSVGFSSKIRSREINGLSLIECRCDPCSGRRDRTKVHHECPSFGIQIIQSGVEKIQFGTEQVIARAGDVIAWRSDVPYEFEVLETMQKTTLVVPWSDVASRIPRAARFRGARTTTNNGVGLLVEGLMQQMVRRIDDLRQGERSSGVKGVFLAASAALLEGSVKGEKESLAEIHLEQIQQYILRNLHDISLSAETVARSQRISVRYLHKLFERAESSVSAYIHRLRLSRCKEDLLDPQKCHLNVMEIASVWGYTDASVFSKAFKREFGMSATQWREGSIAEGAPIKRPHN
ncbi:MULTISPECIES: helix-turn-helix domain-containing protein [unclassified Hwanghaeella]|jgi:AraC-like DNA-binding protein|uniref:helix-turn-helix domain-containing protein n=1 Tax=unclassified Hwanghaeella TaxID=2605944 RepID=UPI002695F2C5|tara:strand:+ start:1696 stop:2691 length:996 start_codon:yes stop_codon:yes gene_type:complete